MRSWTGPSFTGNPHLVLEGLIIGAWAIGAHQGFIYTRHDSKLLKKNIDLALEQARESADFWVRTFSVPVLTSMLKSIMTWASSFPVSPAP